jgi:maleylacetate reductase
VDFTHEFLPQRVRFGAGRAADHVAQEFDGLGAQRVLVLASPRAVSEREQITRGIAPRVAGVFDAVREHVPAAVAEAARAAAAEVGADALLAIGGGSAIGTAKAIALTTGLPIVTVPTTFSGSEATPVWGITTDGRKETGIDRRVLARSVVYDSELTRGLPREIAIPSGFNALAHCVEAVWAPRTTPVAGALALEAVRALDRGMTALAGDRATADDHDAMLYGAYLAGTVFALAGSGLHHKICHALGGAFDLPHAGTHTVVLPHVLAFTEPAIGDDARRLADAWGAPTASEGLTALLERTSAPRTLVELGFDPGRRQEAIDVVTARLPIDHPRLVDGAAVEGLLGAIVGG